jgi:F-type H+-transporting ATPase subunit b
MRIDWFTIAAQILNFLVLVYLLRRFLYPAIIGAMDKREKLIADRLAAAEEKAKKASEAEVSYILQKQELAASSEQLIAQARQEAETLRQKLSDQARADVDADKSRWREAIKSQEDEFLQLLKVRTAEQVTATVRRTLQDLADEQLEQRIVSRFVERLQNTEKVEIAAIRKTLEKDKTGIRVASAFELPEDTRRLVRDALRTQLSTEVEPTFETSDELIGGIELRVGEIRISWNLQSYVDELEQQVSKAMEDVK